MSLIRRTLKSSLPFGVYNRRHYSFHPRAPEQSQEVAELLNRYQSTPPLPLNLAQLLSYGHPVTPQSVLSSVTYALSELPRRMATRVRSLEGLPFIVGMNPYVAKMLDAYRESFAFLATYPTVTSLEENSVFVQHLTNLVRRHANDIPTLAKGYLRLFFLE
jgi:26S proteasome regulatory subunit T1